MLENKKIVVSVTADARKEAIDGEQALKILRDASKIIIANGKKTLTLSSPGQTDPETLLAAVLGRSGTLRAPTLKIGTIFLVGFNEEIYSENLCNMAKL